MQNQIIYNSILYRKHQHQKYFYCAESIKKSKNLFSRILHRQMWFDAFGKIPVGFHIHHKDGNAFNNSIENFELVPSKWHATYHSKEKVKKNPDYFLKLAETGREFAKEWHKSKEGREWHKENARLTGFGKRDYGKSKCLFCEKEYLKKSVRSKFCSNNCKSAWRRKNTPDKTIATCITCGKTYETSKYFPKKYCSKHCTPPPNPKGFHARNKS